MSIDEKEVKETDSNDKPVPEDHPGLQKFVKNENPRANENIPGEKSETGNSSGSQAGSEVTDGEDG